MGASTRASLENIRAEVANVTPSLELVSGVLGVGRAIAAHTSLLQALADHGHSANERVALLNSALGQASAEARAAVSTVVSQRWSKPSDLLAGIEEMAVRVASQAAGTTDLIGELLQAGRAIRGHSDLQLALSDKRAEAVAKMALVEKIFGNKLSGPALEVAKHVVALPRGRRVSDALAQTARMVAGQQGQGLAEVRVASAITGDQQRSISETLKRRFGQDHYIDAVIDESVIGGVRIRVGDVVIDASVSKQLSDMRIQLAG